MSEEKQLRIHNKSDRPLNIIEKERRIFDDCIAVEGQLPIFLKGFFVYLKGNVLPQTRLAYLRDIRFFCEYLISETDRTSAKGMDKITLEEFENLKSSDINLFLDYCRHYTVEKANYVQVVENENRTLARKRASMSVLFKFLYRNEMISRNISDGLTPIRVPKPGEREIKALQDAEVVRMLHAVESGEGLSRKEKDFWRKTKYRDRAILMLFLTYGLRLSELQQLNVSSFNFSRGEFKIYRKRGKESIMPLNKSVLKALDEYMDQERRKEEQLDDENKDALFLSLQHRRMTERQIRELVKKYTSIALATTRRAGYSPHKLRATTATSLIGRGNSIYDVQALLDHDNVTTTQLYAAHKKDVKRNLVAGMEWDEEFDPIIRPKY